MKNSILSLVAVLVLSFGCSDRDDDIAAINIRIKNNNDFTYETVQVGGAEMVHQNVGAGEYSDYLEYETAYTYGYIKIEAAGETYVLQPIDFVGETPLGIGFYTYELKVVDGDVSLNFVAD